MKINQIIINGIFSYRMAEIEKFKRDPLTTQYFEFVKLTKHLSRCGYGIERGVKDKISYDDFTKAVEVTSYDEIEPYISRSRMGEESLLWDSPIKWYAKSSGTTSSKSKFIPVSQDSIFKCQYKGMRDVLAFAAHSNHNFNIFRGKTLTLGGAHTLDQLSTNGAHSGDLSSILIEHTPKLASLFRAPSKEIALEPDFHKKVELIAKSCSTQNITAFAGVPSWNLVMLEAVLEHTGKSNICEVWPNIELFMHGGISFTPYRDTYKKLFPSPDMKYIETYNASEGFFAVQDDYDSSDMLLMLDYGVFYEFLPTSLLDDMSKVIPLDDVKLGVNYAMIITTNGGLWRYMIGDTVKFTSLDPYKIKITGRTKHYINAFGEEIIVDNSDVAITKAAEMTGAVVLEYSAGPVYMALNEKGRHEWIVEFSKEPDSFDEFCVILDKTLQSVNSDYEAKRTNNTTLHAPIVRSVASGTFYGWMKTRGKLGGQNKIPRLANNRVYIDSILEYIRTTI